MKPDARSFRIALVADQYVNCEPGGVDGLAILADQGWGVIQLPAEDYPAEVAAGILAEIAEQVEEFWRHRYEFVLVGARDGLADALAVVGVAVPDQIVPGSAADLVAFLGTRPVPAPAKAATADRE